MQNDIEIQIKDSLKEDRIKLFYKKNKLVILSLAFVILFLPISFQFYSFYKLKKDERLFSLYVKAETLMPINKQESIKLLNSLNKENNKTIQLLSSYKLINYYIENENKPKALEVLKDIKGHNNILLNQISEIKKIIIEFDNINENMMIDFFKNNKEHFNFIKKKLIYDFYIKSNKPNKAKQFLN